MILNVYFRTLNVKSIKIIDKRKWSTVHTKRILICNYDLYLLIHTQNIKYYYIIGTIGI